MLQNDKMEKVVTTSSSEARKSSKPIMEKRRRARINASLSELKSLLLEVMKKEAGMGSRHSKMEKADILEMTVKHLRQIQRHQFAAAASSDPSVLNKYQMGFNECANEVIRYLSSIEGADVEVRARLLGHLANCIQGVANASTAAHNAVAIVAAQAPQSTGNPHLRPFPVMGNSGNINLAPKMNVPVATTEINNNVINTVTATQVSVSTSNMNNLNLNSVAPPPPPPLPQQQPPPPPPLSQQQQQQQQQPHQQHQQQQQQQQKQQRQQHQHQQQQQQLQHQQQQSRVVGGVQILPSKLPTGELAFVIPGNLLQSGQVPSYVIPVYSGSVGTSSCENSPQSSTVSASPCTVSSPMQVIGSSPSLSSSASGQSPIATSSLSGSPSNSELTASPSTSSFSPSTPVTSRKQFEESPMQLQSLNLDNVPGHMHIKDENVWRPW